MALHREHGRNWAVDYGFAAGALACAMLIRWALDPWLGERAPSLVMLLAIALVSAWGGWRVGIFLTVIGGVLANVLFVAPRGVFYIAEVTPLLQFVLFIGVGVGISLIAEFRLRMQQRAAHANQSAAREALRNQIILESITDGFIALDEQWRYTYVNSAAERLHGRTRDELLGKIIWEVLPELRDTQLPRELKKVVAEGKASRFEFHLADKDCWLDLVAYPCERELYDARCVTVFFQDVTARKQAERTIQEHHQVLEQQVKHRTAQLETAQQALRRTERLASLGTLSAGITHDIGNLMLPVRIRLQALERMNLPHEAREHMKTIADATRQLIDLTNLLRAFSVDPMQPPSPGASTDLAELCKRTERLHRSVLPEHVDLQCEIDEELPPVAMSASSLAQAMFNLVLNAGEAIAPETAGQVIIDARRTSPTQLEITVRDNGRGMTADELSHCLEPFYTTKTREISTGLGLSLVHGIMKSAGGSMDVQSPPPGEATGTLVVLTLPISSGQLSASDAREALLLVDDPRIAGMFSTMLQMGGWLVQRIAMTDELQEADLLVTDAVDERLETARRFRELSPHASIIAIGSADGPWNSLGAAIVDARPTPATVRKAMSLSRSA